MSQIFRKSILHCLKVNQRLFSHRAVTQYTLRIESPSPQCTNTKHHFSTFPGQSSSTPPTADSFADSPSASDSFADEDEPCESRKGPQGRYTDQSRYEAEMPIEIRKAGLLIGQAGIVIRQLMQMTGCSIKVRESTEDSSQRTVEISSEIEARLGYAMTLIQEIVSNTTNSASEYQDYQMECHIPMTKVGALVGKGGENIIRLRALNNCDIRIERKDAPSEDKKMKISFAGNVINCYRARESVLASLNLTRESLEVDEHETIVPVPTSFNGELIGKGGSTVRLLNQMVKCDIRLDPDSRGVEFSDVLIRGVERDVGDVKDILAALARIHTRNKEITSSPSNL